MKKKYLFYISQNYAFEILRPIEEAIMVQGNQCVWFVEGSEVDFNYFSDSQTVLPDIQFAVDYRPDAVIVPGNLVPDFISGLKVQVFHGLEWKKKGHFAIRGFFDLYCTHGQITTQRFNQLAKKHQYFRVIETGWPKLDPLFSCQPYQLQTEKPVILFAPTFSPNLTCAVKAFDEISRLVKSRKYHWLVKFHPKMKKEWIDLYRAIECENLQIIDTDSILPLLKRADILISDTSSVIGEFLLLNKPAITINNAKPNDYLIDIHSPDELEQSISQALLKPESLMNKIKNENQLIHPYQDGKSAERILAAIDQCINESQQKKKPLNIIRKLKLRKKLGYWKF
ncbi:MAG: CDP-glycerol glycerophosphotransferase family protein [Gammaproteobacteria bacterium]|nr:CDP-glycerol glycerophosphotransferase family protein [Gammaproteobacteria bacterium]